jgi:very-short-patch-repair endonuclease
LFFPLHEGEGQGEGAALPLPTELLIFARQLRKEQTDAEKLLWRVLRGRHFCGFKFRRQYPICGYILDFYCHDAGLAVELDGGGHNHEEQRLYDEERTKALTGAGIRVIRFWKMMCSTLWKTYWKNYMRI